MMKQGWTALSKLQASANQPTPTQQLQQASESLVKGTKRKSKAAAKAAEQNGNVFDNTYGVYKDADDIEKQLVSKLSETSLKKTRYNMLLILDDVIGDIKAFENNPMQQKLFFNRRHLIANGTISIIIVSQKYTMCPSRIRSNCSWLLLFRLNPVDFENVYKDVIMMGQERWSKLIQQVFGTDTTASNTEKKQKSYDNLGIWVEYDMFFKDFQKLNIQ